MRSTIPTLTKLRRAALVGTLTLTLGAAAACGSDSASDSDSSTASSSDRPAWCGDSEDDIVVGISDGYGNPSRQIFKKIVELEAAKCPLVKEVIYTDGQGDPQKTIGNVNSLVAQGANVIVANADFGASELPAFQAATNAGAKVVLWLSEPGGEAGKDYEEYVHFDTKDVGVQQAKWLGEQLGGEGNVLFFGGPAGNPFSTEMFEAFKSELATSYPGVKILEDDFVATNWDVGQTQQVTSALLSKYPQIDGFGGDYIALGLSVVRAFEAADRDLVPFSGTGADNVFSCTVKDLAVDNPGLKVMTLEGSWKQPMIALQKGVAAASGGVSDEPSVYPLELFFDSSVGEVPCDPELPDSAFLDTNLTSDELKDALG